jgi:hypothetical protein
LEENIHGHPSLAKLNERGEDGWELCTALLGNDGVRLVYKRAKPVFVPGEEEAKS